MFWRQIAQQMNQLNLTCFREAAAVISGFSGDNEPFYGDIIKLSGVKLDALLIQLVEKDRFCHSFDKVSCRLSDRVFYLPSIPSGEGVGNALFSCSCQTISASDCHNLPNHETSRQIP